MYKLNWAYGYEIFCSAGRGTEAIYLKTNKSPTYYVQRKLLCYIFHEKSTFYRQHSHCVVTASNRLNRKYLQRCFYNISEKHNLNYIHTNFYGEKINN